MDLNWQLPIALSLALLAGIIAVIVIPIWAWRLNPAQPEDAELLWLNRLRKHALSIDTLPIRAIHHPNGLLTGFHLGSHIYLSGRASLAVERGVLELFLFRSLNSASDNLRSGDIGVAFKYPGIYRTLPAYNSNRWIEHKWIHNLPDAPSLSPTSHKWVTAVEGAYQIYPGLKRVSTFGDRTLLVAEPYLNTHDTDKLLNAVRHIVLHLWSIDFPTLREITHAEHASPSPLVPR